MAAVLKPLHDEEEVSIPSLPEMGIDHKLSSQSQKIGGIGEQAFEAVVDSKRCSSALPMAAMPIPTPNAPKLNNAWWRWLGPDSAIPR